MSTHTHAWENSIIYSLEHSLTYSQPLPSYYIHSASLRLIPLHHKNNIHPIKIKCSTLPKLIFAQTKIPSILPNHSFINNLFTFMTYFSNNSVLYYNHKKEVSNTKYQPYSLSIKQNIIRVFRLNQNRKQYK